MSHLGILYYGLFLLSLLATSWWLGKSLLYSPRMLPAPRLTRFLLGFCLGPYLIAGVMLVLYGLLPGGPRLLYLAAPLTVACIGLALFRRASLRPLVVDFRRRWRANDQRPLTMVMYLCLVPVAAMVLYKLFSNAQFIIYGDDALKYMKEALFMAEGRSWASLPGFDGGVAGNTASSAHSPIYQLLLAFSLLFTPAADIGFPNDQVARSTVQILIVYMGLSAVALAQFARRPGAGALSLLLMAGVVAYWGFGSVHSRDAFRISALVCFVIVLLPLAYRRCRLQHGMLLAAATMIAALSHVVDMMSVALIAGGFTLYKLRLGEVRSLMVALPWIAVGGVAGSVQLLYNKWTTGHLTGMAVRRGFKDTPLWDALLDTPRFRLAAEMSLWERFESVLLGQGLLIAAGGLLIAIAIAIRLCWRHPTANERVVALLAVAVLALYVPVTGIFDGLPGLPISYLFTTNMRYLSHVHPLTAVLFTSLLFAVPARAEVSAKLPAMLAACVPVIAVAVLGYRVVDERWVVMSEQREARILQTLTALNRSLDDAHGTVVVDQDFIRYYLKPPTAYLGYFQLRPLLRATNQQQLHAAMRSLGVSTVLLQDRNVNALWRHVPLVGLLRSSDAVTSTVLVPGLTMYRLSREGRTAPDDLMGLLDRDGDGALSRVELPAEVRERFLAALDDDGNSMIEYAELARMGRGYGPDIPVAREPSREEKPHAHVLRDLSYGGPHDSEPRRRLDLYLPKTTKPFPVLLLLHGGGLYAGSKSQFRRLGLTLARSGIGSVAPNYRLSPAFAHPAQIRDAALAFTWIRRYIGEYGGDADNVGLLGSSAGAWLALLLSHDERWLAEHDESRDAVRAIVGISALVDLTSLSEFRKLMTWQGDPEVLERASPLTYAASGQAPTLMLVGDAVPQSEKDQSRAFVDRLAGAGRQEARLLVLRGRHHATILPNLSEPDDPGYEAVLAFLQRHLGSPGDARASSGTPASKLARLSE